MQRRISARAQRSYCYEGGIILPGLGEGHGHVGPGGTEALFTVHLNLFGTLEDHLDAVKEFAEKHPELDVIQGAGFIPTPDMGPDGPPQICSTV